MNVSDMIGFAGVSILLVAFFLNLTNKLHKDSLGYILLNIIGAGIACLASVLINYVPFIVLEGTWTIVSVWALIGYYKNKKAR
ncbi:MAG: hypothetical protein IPH89_15680 [Bacteroidetes bacterium]|nr:hypothetical protein [Bacteroidota bacterium]